MALLEIKKYPDPILRKKCQEVEKIDEGIKNLGQQMVETMEVNQGIGLAAPQIGVLKKMIVIKVDEAVTSSPPFAVARVLEEGPKVFINPKITKRTKETEIMEEGCLSFPGLFLKIKRAKEVEIRALNFEGEEIQIKVRGLMARIFQHEIDHLDGILFIDRIPFWQRLKLKRKLKILKNTS